MTGVFPCVMEQWTLPEKIEIPAVWENIGIVSALQRLLVKRGFVHAQASRFLEPKLANLSDPFLLPEMDQAVNRLLIALEKQEKIVVFGDYDVDGVTSCTLLVRFLVRIGARVEAFLPHRMDEGYGLSREAVERCVAEKNPQLLIAVDCGTTSIAELKWVFENEIDALVFDHHELAGERPICEALVNPKLGSDFQYLASVGICFKVLHALSKRIKEISHPLEARLPDLREFLDLVAVGTVADLVPLVDDNRIFVKNGLQRLATTQWAGFSELISVTQISPPFSTYHVGFVLGPRLNASGRLESAMASLELLLTDERPKAAKLATELHETNRQRQDIERQLTEEALKMARQQVEEKHRHILVLWGKGWHVGVIGIVASRVLREFNRPVIVIGVGADGVGKGSCRSIDGFNMVEALDACRKYLAKCGGHAMAAGLTVEESQIESFCVAVEEFAAKRLADDPFVTRVRPDVEVTLAEVNEQLLNGLKLLEPFGSKNPEPLFVSRGVRVVSEPILVGKEGKHMRLFITDGKARIEGIYFGWGDRDLPSGLLDVAYYPDWNEYNGRRVIQLKLKALRAVT